MVEHLLCTLEMYSRFIVYQYKCMKNKNRYETIWIVEQLSIVKRLIMKNMSDFGFMLYRNASLIYEYNIILLRP